MRSLTGGPLQGVRVVEFGGIGPGPFCCMLLSDLGADVVRIDRPGFDQMDSRNILLRGRRRLTLDLHSPEGVKIALDLIRHADILIEGFRPGVMERLGLGPAACDRYNDRLIYGRLTGWGRDGPLSQEPGHDLNYLAITGILDTIGRSGDPPIVPLNYIADYGAGGFLMAYGVLAAIYERSYSGRGQVVDAAMVDGLGLMLGDVLSRATAGDWCFQRGSNIYDGGAPFYDVYGTKDGAYIAVAAIEPKFFRNLLSTLGLHDIDPASQYDSATWPDVRDRLTEIFSSASASEWEVRFRGVEACVTAVVPVAGVPSNPHALAREMYVEVDGGLQPAPAPRFGRSRLKIQPSVLCNSGDIISEWMEEV